MILDSGYVFGPPVYAIYNACQAQTIRA